MILRLSIGLALSVPSCLVAQGTSSPATEQPERDDFAQADKVYEYAKLEQANSNFSAAARAFAACVPLFERFAREKPSHPDVPKALYRAGVANLLIGNRRQAESKFVATLLKTKKKGSTAAAAAFRLGALAYNDEQFKTALPHFELTATQTDKPALRHKALNYKARSLLLSNQQGKAARVLRQLADDPDEPNEFKNQARLALAHISAVSNKLEEAFELYKSIADIETTEPSAIEIKGQAIVHGGMTAMRLGKDEIGLGMLNTALRAPGLTSEAKAEAQLTLMQHRFSKEDYNQVRELYRLGPFRAERPETTAEILLVAGKSCAKLGQHNAAVELFIGVDRSVPGTRMAFEASYRKLGSFYEMRGTNVPELSDGFVELYGRKYPSNPWIQEARVMKAETHFSFENYAEATETWEKVKFKHLPKNLVGPSLFKYGWSQVENEDYDSAVVNLTQFISRYPDSPDYFPAIAKRAQSYLEVGDRIQSLADCTRILENKKDAPALTAFALQLSGRLYREKGQNKKMIEAYTSLLKGYDSLSQDTVARANYNIGLGYFDEGEYETALLHLKKARQLVPEFYEETAGTSIAQCYYHLQRADQLRQTLTRLYAINPEKVIPRRLLVWLGLEMYEISNFPAATHYLSLVLDSEEPREEDLGLWKALAKSCLATPGHEEKALKATSLVLNFENDTFWRCDAFLDRANTLIALQRWNEAEIAAHRGLDLDPQGTIKAGLYLTLGDVSLAHGNYNSAASSYVRAAEFFLSDANIQPLALYKAAWCLRKSGDQGAASAFEERLKIDHPDWKAPRSFKIKPGSALEEKLVNPAPQAIEATPVVEKETLPTGIVPITN